MGSSLADLLLVDLLVSVHRAGLVLSLGADGCPQITGGRPTPELIAALRAARRPIIDLLRRWSVKPGLIEWRLPTGVVLSRVKNTMAPFATTGWRVPADAEWWPLELLPEHWNIARFTPREREPA